MLTLRKHLADTSLRSIDYKQNFLALLQITKQELSRHNREDDAWLAIRGKVYNVTAYLPFHPGGPDELMKGVGIDATRLFDQVNAFHEKKSFKNKVNTCEIKINR